MEMEKKQDLEWKAAQKIEISVDLVAAAKTQLQFLQAVDKNRCLYGGPALKKAIYRYNACWLPLLAKHRDSGPLVVPLDCEWVWHCHRLNPVQYKSDCEELYGKILDNSNVASSVEGISEIQTKEIWNRLYPDEPYEFDSARALSGSDNVSGMAKKTKYDLVSAVERQTPFFYQVSRPHMSNEIFLEEAVGRYKGFLHLIKRNKEMSLRRFCVPTYDIDLIWHTHQLHPVAYCNDVKKELGKVLEHDDTDSDRTVGKKLHNGFSATTKQWEMTFGSRYWKAGAMYRGSAPTPLTDSPSEKPASEQKFQLTEVFLEAVKVENITEEQKGSIVVLFSKTTPDAFFNGKRKLSILSAAREKQVASFQCEPTGEFLFELISLSPAGRTYQTLGTASLSLRKLMDPVSKLSVEKWLELTPGSGNECPRPMRLRVAVSFTIPTPAPYVLRVVGSSVNDNLRKKGFVNGKNMKEVDSTVILGVGNEGEWVDLPANCGTRCGPCGGYMRESGGSCSGACNGGSSDNCGSCTGACNGGSSDNCDEQISKSGGCGGGCGGGGCGGACRGSGCGGGCRGGGCGGGCRGAR